MKEFWNQRYAQEKYAYGQTPNEFFKETIDKYKPGKVLFPAEGEGRNAVYAASKKWEVTAYDYSESGMTKALELAIKKGVTIAYEINQHEGFHFSPNTYDVVGLFYTHVPQRTRIKLHKDIINTLKKNGVLIIEGFSKSQLLYNSGGPKSLKMLYSIAELRKDFEDSMNIEIVKEKVINLKEGKFHKGEASVIRLIAKKK